MYSLEDAWLLWEVIAVTRYNEYLAAEHRRKEGSKAMSILDTFLILIRSNAKDTEKDMDSLDKKVKQTQENIDKTDKSTRQLGLTFDDFVKGLVTASGIDLSIKGLASATKNVAEMEVGLGRLSKLTGIGASDIDAWDQALQRFGAPAGAFEAGSRA